KNLWNLKQAAFACVRTVWQNSVRVRHNRSPEPGNKRISCNPAIAAWGNPHAYDQLPGVLLRRYHATETRYGYHSSHAYRHGHCVPPVLPASANDCGPTLRYGIYPAKFPIAAGSYP